ncbi:hypothetical protein KEM55_008911 [Ascosphaera atra]|nr:hypothetical protein KEM55_008911 [Ascosphaera atra]
MPKTENKKPASAAVNLIAGGGAGMMEALACHPLDTVKVRMQLSRRARAPGVVVDGEGDGPDLGSQDDVGWSRGRCH